MECNLRCVNFRRVSDPRRAFLPAFRVTAISDDWYRSTMGVIVISLRTPRSAGENVGCTWEHLGAPKTSLGAPTTSLGVLMTSLDAPTSLGAPRITVEQSGKASSLGPLPVHLEIIATTHRSTIFETHVFSMYSHLCIYIATPLDMVYLNWLQALLESNARFTWK